MDNIWSLIKMTIALLPTVLFYVLYRNTNLKKPERSRQFLMPVVALVYAILVIIFLKSILDFSRTLGNFLSEALDSLANSLKLKEGFLSTISELISKLAYDIRSQLHGKFMYIVVVVANFLLLSTFLFIKRILISIFRKIFHTGNQLYETVSSWLYLPETDGKGYIKPSTVQARKYLKTFYITALILSVVVLYFSMYLYSDDLLEVPYFPVLGMLVIAEIYFYIDGITKEEDETTVTAEKDFSSSIYNYISLRRVLRRLFGDKLAKDNTTIHDDLMNPISPEEWLASRQLSDDHLTATYVNFMQGYRNDGHVLDQNYLASGLDLLHNKSILFNNPFYYDMIPYAFYVMNHKLLGHGKTLILLGRHGIEEDIKKWCEIGLQTITNVSGMWKIEILDEHSLNPDVGIVTRSGIQNLALHKGNAEFFRRVEYVIIIEPSRLITTAQIGLNSIIRYCYSYKDKKLTFCSTDKNCDGLVDALSHAVMESIAEVSATEKHDGVCSYMSWNADNDFWQHRMLPNIARYVGIGTELSFAALKSQVSKTYWYGGEQFPVTDMHWIAKQYYGDLLSYANLPLSQSLLDEVFQASPNMWDAKKSKTLYLTVEDESYNAFEMKRAFATRAREQSFINVISSQYMLYDYMTENNSIFDVDAKAIPYIVADYVNTRRNILLRLAIRMAAEYVWESDICEELLLTDVLSKNPRKTFWCELCACYNPIDTKPGEEDILYAVDWKKQNYEFHIDIIERIEKYNSATGRKEYAYKITNQSFIQVVLNDLLNAHYIAEEERDSYYIGIELRGQVFQRYLPGQLFTLCGKYYEMLSMTMDGRVLLRRAGDHITGRPVYRQVREYEMRNFVEDEAMGSKKQYNKLQISRLNADLTVKTSAFWRMSAYNDFAGGTKVTVSGVPERRYNHKSVLKINFPEVNDSFTAEVRYTMAALLNELFITLFAENHDYIIATTPGTPGIPLTYDLSCKCDEFDENAIYVIEDSQYDIGLLTAVERNINRIYQILCDYLVWNEEEILRSKQPPKVAPPDYRVSEEIVEEEKKKGFFGKIVSKIGGFFKGLVVKKQPVPVDVPVPEVPETTEKPKEPKDAVVTEVPQTTDVPATTETPTNSGEEEKSETPESKEEAAKPETPESKEEVAKPETPISTEETAPSESLGEADHAEQLNGQKKAGIFSKIKNAFSRKKGNESEQPVISEETKESPEPVVSEETEKPVVSEESKEPEKTVVSEESKETQIPDSSQENQQEENPKKPGLFAKMKGGFKNIFTRKTKEESTEGAEQTDKEEEK